MAIDEIVCDAIDSAINIEMRFPVGPSRAIELGLGAEPVRTGGARG